MAERDEERELDDRDAPLTQDEEHSLPEDTGKDAAERAREQDASPVAPKSKLGENAGDLKGMITGKAKDAAKNAAGSAPGVGEAIEKAEEVKQKVEQGRRIAQAVKTGVETAATSAKAIVAIFANPWVWVSMLVILVVTLLGISAATSLQVFGPTKTSSQTGGASGEMLQRLAQRADWLQKNFTSHGATTGPLYELAPSPKSNLSPNPWASACPNIVAFIYGLSPYLINYNGNYNAYKNWNNHKELYESYAFDSSYGNGSASAGATLSNPPAGAIVSIQYGTEAGHTFVMLTDELVIDNWGGGGVTGSGAGAGPRIISDTMRGQIVGWALPKSTGFEGTFITGSFEGAAEGAPEQSAMPGLMAAPEWAAEGGPSTGDGGAYTGDSQHASWMKSAGIAESDWPYVDYIAMKESSWNPKATNASSGACGLIQALPCSKVPGDGYDPVDNLKWANGYATSRYGSWKQAHAFWVANQWW